MRACLLVCVRACVRARVRSCVRAFVRSCVRAFVRSWVRGFVGSWVRACLSGCLISRYCYSVTGWIAGSHRYCDASFNAPQSIIPPVDMLKYYYNLHTVYSYCVDVPLCPWWYIFIAAQLSQSYPPLHGKQLVSIIPRHFVNDLVTSIIKINRISLCCCGFQLSFPLSYYRQLAIVCYLSL